MMLKILLTLACACVLAAPPVFAQATPEPDPVEACRQIAPRSDMISLELDPPYVEIASPANNTTVQGEKIAITVDTQNFVLGGNNHWHVWVDGRLLGMLYEPSGLVPLQPGEHLICAALSDSTHGTVSQATGIRIVVEPLAPDAPTPAIPAVVGEIIAEPLFDATNLILLVGGGLLAAAGGWWAGQRLARRSGTGSR